MAKKNGKKRTDRSVFYNEMVNDINVADKVFPVEWSLYWLKCTEFDKEIHMPVKKIIPHRHSFFEMFFLEEGSLTYRVGEDTVTVSPGEFLIISPRTEHVLLSMSDVIRKVAIAFEVRFLEENPLKKSLEMLRSYPYLHARQTPSLIQPIEIILKNVNEKDENFLYFKRCLLDVFIMSLLKTVPQNQGSTDFVKEDMTQVDPNDEIVCKKVEKYLSDNLGKNVSLEDVADALLISQSQLSRRIIRYRGCSFSKIKDQIKREKACELLASDMSMEQISEALGISNEYSFNRFFKRVEGMPPGRFREALKTSNYK